MESNKGKKWIRSKEANEKLSDTRKRLIKEEKIKPYIRTKEHKELMSRKIKELVTQKKLFTKEHIENLKKNPRYRPLFQKGNQLWKNRNNEYLKQRIKEAMNNPDVRLNNSIKAKLRWQNPEFRKRICESFKKRILSEESNIKRSKALQGEKCYLWKGGISFEPYSSKFNKQLKKEIKKRDNFTCQNCNKKENLCIHHIDYNKQNCSHNNLITVCNSCNSKFNFNREKWTEYFKNNFIEKLLVQEVMSSVRN